MSDWDFLWGLKGQELEDAMSSGGTKEDWDFIDAQLSIDEKLKELAQLKETGQISKSAYKRRRSNLLKKNL